MTKQPPRRIPPFALEILAHHPLAMTLPAAGFGMLCRLIFHFILTNCRPIPKTGDDLCGIMRAHRPTFNTHKKDIMEIFQELAPKLQEADRIYKQRIQRVKDLGEKGNVSRRLRAITDKPTRPNADSALAVTAPKRERTNPTRRPFTNPDSAWRE